MDVTAEEYIDEANRQIVSHIVACESRLHKTGCSMKGDKITHIRADCLPWFQELVTDYRDRYGTPPFELVTENAAKSLRKYLAERIRHHFSCGKKECTSVDHATAERIAHRVEAGFPE